MLYSTKGVHVLLWKFLSTPLPDFSCYSDRDCETNLNRDVMAGRQNVSTSGSTHISEHPNDVLC